jgi:AcrR family transcriptional regulator
MSAPSSQPGPVRAERLAPALRRELLLDAALRLAEGHGFTGMSVEAVAREAGVTRPVIYSLFGDLDALLLALVDREVGRALADLAEAVPEDPGERDPEAVLVEGVLTFLAAVQREPRTWRLVLLPPAGSPDALRERIASNRRALAARISELLAWGLERRGGPAGLDHDVLARLLIAAAEDAARLTLAHPRRYSPARMAQAARGMLALLPAAAR